MTLRLGCALLALLALAPRAGAHDARPASLSIEEVAPGSYDVVWRTPVFSGMRLPVALQLPDDARTVREPVVRELSDSVVERRRIEAPGGLAGKRIGFVGLEATITDVLVRVQPLAGAPSTTLVRPSRPFLTVAASEGPFAVAVAFVRHGVEHILLGYDHLLFVLALLLIVRSIRVLVVTITAFTLAHSITLALATLGVVHVPGPPVEATIALSIVLLAAEIVRLDRGETSLTARWPWGVAFAFGLLHGLGFAGALAEVGLPPDDLPLALLAFNVGVELGQLAFIGALVAPVGLVRALGLGDTIERPARRAAPVAIGVLAAFWFFERVAAF